jgi:hypothetical protein
MADTVEYARSRAGNRSMPLRIDFLKAAAQTYAYKLLQLELEFPASLPHLWALFSLQQLL